jgi:hypothetical protein
MDLIRETKSIISGSTVIQYFSRELYPGTDLDIYSKDFTRASKIIEHLKRAEGYLSVEESGFRSGSEDDSGGGRFVTRTLVRERDGAKIQVLTTWWSPVDAIVTTFYSTAVVNIITGYAAYSLFPKATFVDGRMFLLKKARTEAERKGVEKYERRGFELCPITEGVEELRVVRKLYDKYAWRIIHHGEDMFGGGMERYRYVLGIRAMVKLNSSTSSDGNYSSYVRYKGSVTIVE